MKIPIWEKIKSTLQRQEIPAPLSTIYAAINDLSQLWEVSDDRKSIYDDIDRMAKEDDYVAEAFDVLLSDIFPVKSFYDPLIDLECKDERVKREINLILKIAKMDSQIRNIGYNYLRYQNSYGEFIVYPNGRDLADLAIIPQVWSMYRNVDNHGRLKGGEPGQKNPGVCAYDQRDDTGKVIAEFRPFQIVHWRGAPYTKEGYGIPFLQSARKNWLRLQQIEDAMVRARIIRAYLKLIHHVPVPNDPTPEQIQQHINQYKRSLSKQAYNSLVSGLVEKSYIGNPVNEATDYYMPRNEMMQGKIDHIDPSNAQLQNLADVEYFQNRLFARLKVPKARLANERDVNAKATLIEQNTAYAATITGFQIDILTGIIELVNRALFLKGFPLDRLEYKLILPSPFVKNELERAKTDQLDASRMEKLARAKVLSRDTIRQQELGFDEKESSAEEEKVKAEMEEFPSGPTGLFASEVHTSDEILRELTQLKKEVKDNGSSDSKFIYRR